MVKSRHSIQAGALVSAMTLAVIMGMGGVNASVGLGAVLYSTNHASLRGLSEEDTQHWIDCLAEAARSFHGKPVLPERLVAAVALPLPLDALHFKPVRAPALTRGQSPPPPSAHLTLDLIALPPPAMA